MRAPWRRLGGVLDRARAMWAVFRVDHIVVDVHDPSRGRVARRERVGRPGGRRWHFHRTSSAGGDTWTIVAAEPGEDSAPNAPQVIAGEPVERGE